MQHLIDFSNQTNNVNAITTQSANFLNQNQDVTWAQICASATALSTCRASESCKSRLVCASLCAHLSGP